MEDDFPVRNTFCPLSEPAKKQPNALEKRNAFHMFALHVVHPYGQLELFLIELHNFLKRDAPRMSVLLKCYLHMYAQ